MNRSRRRRRTQPSAAPRRHGVARAHRYPRTGGAGASARHRRPAACLPRAPASSSARARRRAAFAAGRPRPRPSTRSRAPPGSPPTGGTSAANAPSSRRRPRSRCWPRSGSRRERRAGARKPDPASSTKRAGAASRPRSCCASTSRWPCRCATRRTAARPGSRPKTEALLEWRVEAGEGARHDLPDGPRSWRADDRAARTADRPPSAHRRRRRHAR